MRTRHRALICGVARFTCPGTRDAYVSLSARGSLVHQIQPSCPFHASPPINAKNQKCCRPSISCDLPFLSFSPASEMPSPMRLFPISIPSSTFLRHLIFPHHDLDRDLGSQRVGHGTRCVARTHRTCPHLRFPHISTLPFSLAPRLQRPFF